MSTPPSSPPKEPPASPDRPARRRTGRGPAGRGRAAKASPKASPLLFALTRSRETAGTSWRGCTSSHPAAAVPTATSKCACGRDRSAVGRRETSATSSTTTARTATHCPLRTPPGREGSRMSAPRRSDPAASDGAALLDEVEAFHRRFNVFPLDAAYVAVTLWDAHAHLLDCFDATPRIAFLSPEPGSGKSRALEIVETLVPKPLVAANASASVLFRAVSTLETPAHDPVRRDRHRLRPQGRGQRTAPRIPERRPPARGRHVAVRRRRRQSAGAGVPLLLRRGHGRTRLAARTRS